ncbi:MAG: hypothetical protein AAF799_31560 [Myxococcota bacterium]
MSRRRATSRVTAWGAGLALVAACALPRPGWSATVAPPTSALEQARAQLQQDDPLAAIATLEGGLAELGPQALRREPDDRALLLLELSTALERAHDQQGDPAHLQRARDRLQQLLEESEIHGYAAPLVDRALAERDRMEERLLAVPGPDTVSSRPLARPARSTPANPGRGWMIAGGTTMGVGVGVSSLAFVGVAMSSRADSAVARTTVPSTEAQRIDAIEQGQRGNRFAIAGTVAATALVVAGLGVLLWGVRVRRRAAPEPAARPLVRASFPGGLWW